MTIEISSVEGVVVVLLVLAFIKLSQKDLSNIMPKWLKKWF
jgi:hypothetical protein